MRKQLNDSPLALDTAFLVSFKKLNDINFLRRVNADKSSHLLRTEKF